MKLNALLIWLKIIVLAFIYLLVEKFLTGFIVVHLKYVIFKKVHPNIFIVIVIEKYNYQ